MGWRDLILCLKSTECLRKSPSALHSLNHWGPAGQINLEYLEGEVPCEPPHPVIPGTYTVVSATPSFPSPPPPQQRSRNPCKHWAGGQMQITLAVINEIITKCT